MNKKIFLTCLCGTLLLQTPIKILAKGEDDELTPMDDSAEIDIPDEDSYSPNIVIPDEGSDSYGISVAYYTISKIRSYYEAHPIQYLTATYDTQPSTTEPYSAGALSSESLSDALNTVNLIRYIAGLSNDVTLNSTYTSQVQAGALLNAVNGSISTTPAKPSGMDNTLYQLGCSGNSNALMSSEYDVLDNAIINEWLKDGDTSQTNPVGKRAQLLNANLASTGFGQVGSYTGMYTGDLSGTSDYTSNIWPAQNTPIELFSADDYWSLTTGSTEDISQVSIKMVKTGTTTTYNFSAESSDGYFNIVNDADAPGTIIWKPNSFSFSAGDCYEVYIYNTTLAEEAFYSVTFFQMDTSDMQVILTPSELNLEVGETGYTYVSFLPEDSTDTIKTKTINSEGVNYVSIGYSSTYKRFRVTAVAPGTAIITVTTEAGKVAQCYITVTQPVTGLTLSEESAEIHVGNTYQLTATVEPSDASDPSVTWSSSDESVATVDENGLVTAVSTGTATIRVTSTENTDIYAECTVTVTQPVTSITLSKNTLTLEPEAASQLTATVEPSDASDPTVTWSSDAESVATVSDTGLVTAVSEGTAVITASAGDCTAECTVTVKKDLIILKSASLGLEGYIILNFYVVVPDDETVIVMTDGTTEKRVTAKDAEVSELNGVTRRKFSYPLHAKQLRDTVTIRAEDSEGNRIGMYTSAGTDYTNGYGYTAQQYINAKLNNTGSSENLKTLLTKLDVYGQWAQKQFDHNVTEEIDPETPEVTVDDLTAYKATVSGSISGLTTPSATLVLQSGVDINVYYTIDSSEIASYEFYVDDVKTEAEWNSSKGKYVLTIENIHAKNLGTSHEFKAVKGDEELTITYSALSYAYTVVKNHTVSESAYTNLIPLVKAMYEYYLAAAEYF